MTDTPKLKECVLPWCKGSAHLISDYDHYVECECGVRSDYVTTPKMAIKNWNSIPRRSEVEELLRLVDEVIDTPDWTRLDEVEELIRRADKLRKEWGL